jgi:hypothetical protein
VKECTVTNIVEQMEFFSSFGSCSGRSWPFSIMCSRFQLFLFFILAVGTRSERKARRFLVNAMR